MRRRAHTLGAVALAVASCRPAAPPAGPPTASVVPAARSVAVLGAGGCAARGCHGGPGTAPDGTPAGPSWRNAWTWWAEYDPHGGAFETLRSEPSRRIVARLGGAAAAAADGRCLACHTTPALAAAVATPDAIGLRAEGVGCEACHTGSGRPSSDWMEEHKKGWTAGGGLARCYSDRGMRWLGDPAGRAAVCAGCHVGAPAGDGVPAREVTHDLIAAGHPRLRFDFTAFLAALPPHWAERPRRPTGEGADAPRACPPGHAPQAWLAGEVEAARAGLLLVADQAGRAAGWPELTAFDCYSCHHDLTAADAPGWRQERAGRRPGRVVLNIPGLADPIRDALRADPAFRAADDALAAALGQRPGPSVAAAAAALAARLDAAAPAVRADDPRAWPELLGVLRLADRDPSAARWDDLAQAYSALAAATRGRPDADRDRVHAALRFPTAGPRVGSPAGFDPSVAGRGVRVLAARLAADGR